MKLFDSIHYTGQEHALRKLAIETYPDMVNDIALMSEYDVCELVSKGFNVVYASDEEVGLVRKEDLIKYNNLIHRLSR